DEKMIGLQGIARDITDRKLVEEALRESEEKYRTLMDNISDIVVEIDSQGHLTYVSPQIYDVFGFKPDEVVGKNMYEFIHPDDLEKTIEVTEEAIQGGKLLRFEYRSKHKAGHYVNQSGIGRIIKKNGDFKIVGVLRDITDKKRAEEDLNRTLAELERSNKELEQFAYIASHDLQEPIRMVASYLQLLERRYKDKLDLEAHEFIDFAVDGAKRMQYLINDLLAYSRVSTKGKEFRPTNAEDILNQVLSDLGLMIEDSGASVTHDKLPLLQADDAQLGQIFQNLLGNSLRFHGKESPQVHVSADKQDNEWIFSVKDNGIGIDPQYGDRPFMIFQQLHTMDEYPGTGIGLAVCKRIVERHKGRIWFDSEPGKGTTFYFSIPITEGE
ncbi:MAG: PAS domain S-box protein, partial [Thermoplasmata archaeon]|nr:PAS domain S-box protein [Thermoplasmata archaeon]